MKMRLCVLIGTLFVGLTRNTYKHVKYHYSFKIFPRFWLAKRTRLIHQLPMTKFGRILCLTRKWHKKCSLLQVNELLTEKTCGQGWVVLVVKTKMADTSLVSRVRTGTRRNIAKTARRQLGGRHLLFGEYLRSWTNLTVHYWRWTEYRRIDGGKHVLAMFLN